jgi:hypothetical protein
MLAFNRISALSDRVRQSTLTYARIVKEPAMFQMVWTINARSGRHRERGEGAAGGYGGSIQERRPVRGIEAIAERPDGTRVNFIPYPTPLFDGDGALVGAVNMFIDTTAMKQAQALRLQAIRCRRLASGVNDAQTIGTLNSMADEYEAKARAIEEAN